MKKKVIVLILSFVVVIFLILVNINVKNNRKEYTASFDDIRQKIDDNASTFAYDNYVEIVLAEYVISSKDSAIKHRLILKNITKDDLSFNIQIYKHKKLIDGYISGVEPSVESVNDNITIAPGKRAIFNMASEFLYPYDTFSEKDIKEVDALASKLYAELRINDEFAYFEVPMQRVEQFSD